MGLLPSPLQILKNIGSSIGSVFGIGSSTPSPATPKLSAPAISTPALSTPTPVKSAFALPSPAALLKSASQSFGVQGIIKPAAAAVTSAASSVVRAYQGQTKNIQDVGAGTLKVTPDDLLEGAGKVATGLGNATESVVHGFNQGILRIGQSTEAALPGGKEVLAKAQASPAEQKLQASITGAPTVPTYQDIYTKATSYATSKNATPAQAKLFGGLAVAGSLFADNPLGAPEGEAFKISAQGIKDLAAATTDDAAKDVLKREVPSLSDQQLSVMAPAFRAAPDEARVKALADGISQAANAPVRAPSTAPPAPEEIRALAERVPPPPDEVALQTAETAPVPRGLPATADEAMQRYQDEVLTPRANMGQARIIGADDLKDYFGKDYDIARHPIYSKASNDLLFKNAADSDNPTVIFTAGGTGAGKSELIARHVAPEHDGVIYDSTLLNYDGAARQIADLRAMDKNPEIYAVIRDPQSAYSFTKIREAAGGHPVSDAAFIRSHSQVADNLIKLSEQDVPIKVFDMRGLTTPEDFRNAKFASDPLAVLHDSRYSVEDVKKAIQDYKDAQAAAPGANAGDEAGRLPASGSDRASETGGSTASGSSRPVLRSEEQEINPELKPASPNLIRAISREDLPGPISELLQSRYPFLSERTRELFAGKLAGMRRTPDIEAVLRMLSSTDEALKATAPQALKIPAERAAAAGLDRQLADILTPQEMDRQIDLVSRSLHDPERAALAQQEYDLLWEHASQPVINRMNELDLNKSFLDDILASDPAEQLYQDFYRRLGRDVDDPTYALQDVAESATSKAQKIARGVKGLTLAKYEQNARNLDTLIHELGYEDFDAAQAAVEKYKKTLDQRNAISNQLRDLRPRARAIRILQPFMEDVPVIQREDVGMINALTDKSVIMHDYHDITGFTGGFRDVFRNFEHFFGKHYDAAKKAILDPLDKAKGNYIENISQLGRDLDEGVASKFGIKRGSKEDKAIMDYGERNIASQRRVPGLSFDNTTPEGLAKNFGQKRAEQIMEAEQWFRKQYDTLIDELNDVRRKIYPNNPGKLIPKRADYFRHYQEMGGTFRELVDLFETPAGIDPQLAGISEFTKPLSKFLSFAQERIGEGSERSAIGGYLDYAPAFSYAKHIDPEIGKFRYLRRMIAENAPTPGPIEYNDIPVDALPYKGTEKQALKGGRIKTKEKGVNHFLEYLDDYANSLSGKSNPVDRYVQKRVPGGRTTLRAITWINSRIKANQILGNLSSSIAQLFNLPQMIASAKLYMVPGANRALASLFKEDENMAASTFLKERYHTPLTSQFKLSWIDHPLKASSEELKEWGAWITQVTDEMATKWGWQGHFLQAQDALSKSVDGKIHVNGVEYKDPVKYADDAVRKLVAGRGIGEVPIDQQGKMFQLIAPFQVEVGNAWWAMKDMLKARQKYYTALDKSGNAVEHAAGGAAATMGTIATFLVASYLMNQAAQKVRGSGVIFDPINATIQGGIDAVNEYQDGGDIKRAALIFMGRELGEILSNVPLGQTIAAAIPDQWVQNAGFPGGKQEVFGNANPGRFGSGLLALDGLSDPLFKLIPPAAGAQAEKTIKGIEAMVSGVVNTGAGKLAFNVKPTPASVVQAVLFGANATPEAQKYYEEQDQLFMRVYRQEAQRTDLNIEAESTWKQAQDINKKEGKDAAIKFLTSATSNNQELGPAVAGVAQSEAQGLNGVDRLVSMLGVSNGERAKYVIEEVKALPNREQQVAFLQRLSDEKLISKDVANQLIVLGLKDAVAPQ